MFSVRSTPLLVPFLVLGCAAGGGATDSDDDEMAASGGSSTAPGGDGDVAATGGATTATGGATSATGGLAAASGGASAATGGSAAGTGGTGSSETCTPGGSGFMGNGDHAIDLSTCVYYQSFASTGEHQAALPHTDAMAACEALSLAGFDDWRLPTVAELQAIIDTSSLPAADPTYFPGTQSGMYWTSRTTSSKVTALDFWNNGFQNDNIGPDGAQAFRCVRAPL